MGARHPIVHQDEAVTDVGCAGCRGRMTEHRDGGVHGRDTKPWVSAAKLDGDIGGATAQIKHVALGQLGECVT